MREIARRLVAEITQRQKDEWRDPALEKWVRESAQLSGECSYRRDCDADQPFLENGDFLSDTYWNRSGPIGPTSVVRAATRLAVSGSVGVSVASPVGPISNVKTPSFRSVAG